LKQNAETHETLCCTMHILQVPENSVPLMLHNFFVIGLAINFARYCIWQAIG